MLWGFFSTFFFFLLFSLLLSLDSADSRSYLFSMPNISSIEIFFNLFYGQRSRNSTIFPLFSLFLSVLFHSFWFGHHSRHYSMCVRIRVYIGYRFRHRRPVNGLSVGPFPPNLITKITILPSLMCTAEANCALSAGIDECWLYW